MKRLNLLIASLVVISATSACNIYFGGDDDDDDDDDDCQWGGGGGGDDTDEAPGAAVSLRDPYTGLCTDWAGGGGGCDDACGCPPATDQAPEPQPSYGECYGGCAGLDETTCQATWGCRAAYLETCVDDGSGVCDYQQFKEYFDCWAVDRSGPIQGSCDGLDAWTCSQHDDCVAIHDNTCNGWSGAPTPDGSGGGDDGDAKADVACGLGWFLACATEAPPDPANCASDADCGEGWYCNAGFGDDEVCLPPPPPDDGGGMDGGGADVPVQCWGYCYEGTSPPCTDLGEDACVVRDDCEAYYQGVDCTCDEAGACTCNDWVFTVCLGPDTPPPPDEPKLD